MSKIAIIGGGAAGLIAAIAAKRTAPACGVTLLERLPRVGKKLLATGNGRCNITNINALLTAERDGRLLPVHYHGQQSEFCLDALGRYDVDFLVDFYGELGMTIIFEGERGYPITLQAGSVLDLLRFSCEKLGVDIECGREIHSLGELSRFDKVIVTTGGCASPHLGSDGSGYALLKSVGHRCTPLYPAITQIKTPTEFVRQLKGVRVDARVSLGGRSETDELLFTEYGLSGPAALQLSRAAAVNDGQSVEIDLMPQYEETAVYYMISRVISNPYTAKLTADNLLLPIMNRRLGQVVMKYAGYAPSDDAASVDIDSVVNAIKHFTLKALGVTGFSGAQVTAGGIETKDFFPETLRSRLDRRIYAAGELLDIDGDCGGFNLQWAFSSGYAAGVAAVSE